MGAERGTEREGVIPGLWFVLRKRRGTGYTEQLQQYSSPGVGWGGAGPGRRGWGGGSQTKSWGLSTARKASFPPG